MNTVEVDEVKLMAEADAAMASAPMPEGVAVGELQALEVEAWGPFLAGMLKVPTFGMIIPQWGVAPELQDEWFNALGQCMDQVFPGGPAGKYACWAQLIAGTVVIGGMAAINNGGTLPPLGPKRALSEKTESAASPAN